MCERHQEKKEERRYTIHNPWKKRKWQTSTICATRNKQDFNDDDKNTLGSAFRTGALSGVCHWESLDSTCFRNCSPGVAVRGRPVSI
mmetsp:Transcript_16219/g.37250  ORF Transcript_16219/g.37250 Transcript_16219/m.37250 type:complete len:87 (-) Transcript_16219:929-1189(-)